MIASSFLTHAPNFARTLAVTAALCLTASGCITLDLGGGGAGEMHETVVLGSDGPKVLMLWQAQERRVR